MNAQYEVESIGCVDIQLRGTDCTTFESAVSNARIALACAVIYPVIKSIMVRYNYENKHNRILWFSHIVLFFGDVFFGCMAFSAVGSFQSVMGEMPAYGDGPDVGYGWGFELFSGLLSWICALLAFVVIYNRVGDDVHEKIFKEENTRTWRDRWNDFCSWVEKKFKYHVLGCPRRFMRERARKAEAKKRWAIHEKELKTRDTRNIYWGPDGNLWTGRSIVNRDEELLDILENDTFDESDPTALWVIMPSRWLRRWLLFCKFKVAEEPGTITMMSLLVKDPNEPTGYRPKKTLKPPNYTQNEDPKADDHPGHYRRVTLEVWLKFLDLYGSDGPALAVLGIPYDELSRWSVFVDPRTIETTGMAPPVIPTKEEKVNPLEGALGSVAGVFSGLLGRAPNDKTEKK